MAFIKEPERLLKLTGKYDVVVCGGGPAGIGAAISAARNGVKTILIEKTGCLGGMGTAGLVPCFAPFTYAEEPTTKGLALELLDRLKAIDGVGMSPKSSTSWMAIDPEKMKLLADEMMAEAGVTVLFFTNISDVILKNGKLKAVIIENKSGRSAILGKTFIDCTGDGDIAAKAHVPFEKGDAKDRMQPVTVCFTAAGIDSKRFKTLRNVTFKGSNTLMTEKLLSSVEGKKLPTLARGEYRFIAQKDLGNSVWGFNFGHVYAIDGTNAYDLSRAISYGRKIAGNFIEYARKRVPGFKNAKLVSTAQLVGVRETRRIKGMYRYDIDDYKSLRAFPDTIAIYDYPVDIHGTTKSNRLFRKHLKQFTEEFVLPYGKYYSVPFRTLIPKKTDNLLIAGRCISSDRTTQGALRVIPMAICLGQAAGISASMCAKSGKKIKDTDIPTLQNKLREQGAKLD